MCDICYTITAIIPTTWLRWLYEYEILWCYTCYSYLLCILELVKIFSIVNDRIIGSMCVNSNNNKKYRYQNNNSYKYNISRETATEKVETGPTRPTVTRTGRDKSTSGDSLIFLNYGSSLRHKNVFPSPILLYSPGLFLYCISGCL